MSGVNEMRTLAVVAVLCLAGNPIEALQEFRISRSDLSPESVEVLEAIDRIHDSAKLIRGALVFGTVVNLSSGRGSVLVRHLAPSNLDRLAEAVDATGRIAACRVAQEVGLHTATADWRTDVERRYFRELARQSERVCSR